MLKKILNLFKNSYQYDLEQFILSRNPQNEWDVENAIKQYNTRNGCFL